MKKNYTIICLLFVSIVNIQAQGNVGIGTNTPDASAKLDISSTNMGLLIPRVSLTNTGTWGLAAGTGTVGMIVYNTNAAIAGTGAGGAGFYIWNGSWGKVVTGTIATLTDGKVWIGNASNVPTEQTMSGDATISNTGVLDLNNLAVETAEINDAAVTTIKIADANVITAKIADNAVTGAKIDISGNTNGSLMYYNGTDWVNVAPGTSGQILRTNGAAAPTWSNPNDLFVFENGLTESGTNTVKLGGSLTGNTTITQGIYNMVYNLSGTGDFDVQDNGTSALFVKDDGNVGVNTNNPTEKLHVAGNIRTDNKLIYSASNAGVSPLTTEKVERYWKGTIAGGSSGTTTYTSTIFNDGLVSFRLRRDINGGNDDNYLQIYPSTGQGGTYIVERPTGDLDIRTNCPDNTWTDISNDYGYDFEFRQITISKAANSVAPGALYRITLGIHQSDPGNANPISVSALIEVWY